MAFDPRYADFSPGTILKYRLIERLESGPWMHGDSCAAPDNMHMNRLWPDRLLMRTLVLPTGSPFRVLVGPALAARTFARRLRNGVNRRRAPDGDPGEEGVQAPASGGSQSAKT
jgi:hypothetical protein